MAELDTSIVIELPGQPVGWKAPLGGKRRYPHPRYYAWKEEAALRARVQFGGEPLDGPIALTIEVRSKRGDLANFVKGTEDALEAAGVFGNDRQVVEQHNYLVRDTDDPGVTATVRRLNDVVG